MPEKLNIEQLIKTRLGEAEIDPSSVSWHRIRRRVRRAEFLRFNPRKFNIYYLSGLLLTGSLVTYLLIRTPDPDNAIRQSRPEAPEFSEDWQEALSDQLAEPVPSPGPDPNQNLTGEQSETGNREPGTGNWKPGTGNREPETGNRELAPSKALAKDGGNGNSHPPKPLRRRAEPGTGDFQTLLAYFSTSVQSGCEPLEIEIYNQSLNAETCEWNFGDGTTVIHSINNTHYPDDSEECYPDANRDLLRTNTLKHIYTDPGTYTITLTATNANGLSSANHQRVEVHPKPTADFDYQQIPEEQAKIEVLNYSTGATSYQWQLTNPEPGTLTLRSPGEGGRHRELGADFQPIFNLSELQELTGKRELMLIVTSDQGCTDSIQKPLPAASCLLPAELRFPTAFSPNPTGPTGGYYSQNDISNDIFHPAFSEEPAEYNLKIYNRAGEIIFESRDITIGWDGYRLQEPSPAGVYIWKATGRWKNGQPFEQTGDVTLLWKE